MFCPKCGDPVEQNERYCNKCGNRVENDNTLNVNNTFNQTTNLHNNLGNNNIAQNSQHNNKSNNKMISIGISIGAGILLVIVIFAVIINSSGKYYFSNNSYENNEENIESNNTNSTSTRKSKYSTIIIADNTYSGVKIDKNKDAYDLIVKDSTLQKSSCPAEIKIIEEQIIRDYGITAVNLCEMNINFAKEISNVFKKVYEEYPGVRGYLTNLSLINATMSEGYIAAFMPAFNFATSDTSSTYPWVIKTQILLNTSYFLNQTRLEASVKDGSNSGHFPPNATKYSPVAHELGHYLSFLAMMKNYELNSILLVDGNNVNNFYDLYSDFGNGKYSLIMIKEAYDDYKIDTNTTLTLDEWRASISNYAVAKDNTGNYIYDETIAEAFHDVYLNGGRAKDASKYIVNVLKGKLEE